MQTGPSSRQEIAIHRHCMQALLHAAADAISDRCNTCQGLLRTGNAIEKYLPVTKIESAVSSLAGFCEQKSRLGIYLLVRHPSDLRRVQQLSELVHLHSGGSPVCYLILESTEKGRLEARLFADEACSAPLTLTLQEDGGLYPAVGNR